MKLSDRSEEQGMADNIAATETIDNRAWQNWSRNQSCTPSVRTTASSLAQVQTSVARADRTGQPLRVLGAGHSFGDNVVTRGTLLSLDGMSGIIDVDSAKSLVRVAAGTRLWELNEALDGHGLAMINLGDIDRQSIAGAVSTGTHGTGISMGNLSTLVESVEMVTASGDVVECTADDPDLLAAARVANGALGVITAYTLRVTKKYWLREVMTSEPLSDVLTRLDADVRGNRHFEFFTFPFSDRALVKRTNTATSEGACDGALVSTVEVEPPERISMVEASEPGIADPSRIPELNRRLGWSVGRVATSGPSADVLVTTRGNKFNETEWALPCDAGVEALMEMRAIAERRRDWPVNFPFEVRFVQGDTASMLSPAYGRDTCYIAAHVGVGLDHAEFFAAVSHIAQSYGGRPHWGKMHDLDAAALAPLYPQWEDFNRIRRELDPHGVFANTHIGRVFGN